MQLSGTVLELRRQLTLQGEAARRADGQRLAARVGAVLTLAGAYLAERMVSPQAVIPLKVVLALVLAFCTISLIRLWRPSLVPSKLAQTVKILNLLRLPTEGRGSLCLDVQLDAAQGDTEESWMFLKAPLEDGELELRAGKIDERDRLMLELRSASSLVTLRKAIEALPHHEQRELEMVGEGTLRLELLADRSSQGADVACTALTHWVEWFLERLKSAPARR